jgi:SAM-dependent methyltransferase
MSSLEVDYATKGSDYFSSARVDVIGLLKDRYSAALEIGCGSGETMGEMRSRGLVESAVGIEGFPDAAQLSSRYFDKVICADLNVYSGYEELGKFDLVLCLDVLEHLMHPELVLERLKEVMGPSAKIYVSLPNVRFAPVVFSLVFSGRWDYADNGVLDRTHIRFYTRKTGRELLEKSGFVVEKCHAQPFNKRSASSWLNVITLKLFSGFLSRQFIYEASLSDCA